MPEDYHSAVQVAESSRTLGCRGAAVSGDYTRAVSPALVNELTAGLTRFDPQNTRQYRDGWSARPLPRQASLSA